MNIYLLENYIDQIQEVKQYMQNTGCGGWTDDLQKIIDEIEDAKEELEYRDISYVVFYDLKYNTYIENSQAYSILEMLEKPEEYKFEQALDDEGNQLYYKRDSVKEIVQGMLEDE